MELAEPVRTPLPSSRETARTEEDGMLREDGVREVLARLQRGERIKAIARDLGVALGVPAHLAELRRVASGTFTLDDAATWPLDAARPVMPTVIAASAKLNTGRKNSNSSPPQKGNQPGK